MINQYNKDKHTPPVSELELTITYLKTLVKDHKAELQCVFLILIFWLLNVYAPQIVHITIVAYFLALIFDPLVSKYESKFTRVGVFAFLCFLICSFLFLFLGFLIPVIVRDYSELIKELPEILVHAYLSIQQTIESTFGFTFSTSEKDLRSMVGNIVPKVSLETVQPVASKVRETLFAGYSATLSLINIAILPLLTFYFVKDWKVVNRFLLSLIPSSYQRKVSVQAQEVFSILNSFAKGQASVGLALILLYSLALLIVGIPYAIPIGIVAGVLAIIPYVGFIIGIILAILVQGTYDPSLLGFSKVLGAFVVVQIIESNFITPKIVGDSVGLHPLIVIIALLIGSSLFGIVGLLIAIPITALLKSILSHRLKFD